MVNVYNGRALHRIGERPVERIGEHPASFRFGARREECENRAVRRVGPNTGARRHRWHRWHRWKVAWVTSMNQERSEEEAVLLDLAVSLAGLPGNERRARLMPAAQAVLREAVRPGYRLIYDAHEGLHLHTPSGLWVWFCPTCGAEMEVLVTDEATESPH